MTFIVEDGTNVPNSNSYVDVTYADSYLGMFGYADWTSITDPVIKQNALVAATQAVELMYGQRYLSFPSRSVQSLLFPRYLLIVNRIQIISQGTIPDQLKRAVCEVALMSVQGSDIFPLPKTDNFLRSKKLAISGGPSKDVSWSKNPVTEQFLGFNKVELLLKPILRPVTPQASMSL